MTPATTSCSSYYAYGTVAQSQAGNGAILNNSADAYYCYDNPITSMLVQNAAFDIAGRLTSIQTRTGVVTSNAYGFCDGGFGSYTQYASMTR